jgi:hypothetical protein
MANRLVLGYGPWGFGLRNQKLNICDLNVSKIN